MSRVVLAPPKHRLATPLRDAFTSAGHDVSLLDQTQSLPDTAPDAIVLLYEYDPLLSIDKSFVTWINQTPDTLALLEEWGEASVVCVWPCMAWSSSATPLSETDLTADTLDDTSPCAMVARCFRALAASPAQPRLRYVMVPPLIGAMPLEQSWWQQLIHQAATGNPTLLSASMQHEITLASVHDVARGLITLLSSDNALTSVILGGESITPEDCIRSAAESAGVSPKPVLASDWMLILRGLIGQSVPAAQARRVLAQPWRFSSHTAVTRLVYTRTPIRIVIEKTIAELGITINEPPSTLL